MTDTLLAVDDSTANKCIADDIQSSEETSHNSKRFEGLFDSTINSSNLLDQQIHSNTSVCTISSISSVLCLLGITTMMLVEMTKVLTRLKVQFRSRGISARETGVPEIPDHIKNFVFICDDGSVLPLTTPARFLPDIRQMEIRPSDVFVVSWPKSGTTWMQYIVSQIALGRDFADQNNLWKTHIFLEAPRHPNKLDESEGMYKIAEKLPSPRFLKSHLKLNLLPVRLLDSQAKIIYVARNPKDTAVSYFNYCRMNSLLPPYKDWTEFFEYFLKGLLPYGDWFEHLLPWWEMRNEPNILFMKYEDMIKYPERTVRHVSKFLNKTLSEETLQDISKRSSFDVMKKSPTANPDLMNIPIFYERDPVLFMRKGVIGDWKNYFTITQNERFDELYRRKMEGSYLDFDFGNLSRL
ncbi:Sulfotransferase 1C2 [Holothuria leucospilota]|uniref:Sulfotransferase 1C2 n=1 Tax=Holothuria leucospilota TaxID=206669 RepID=A0A9Q1BEX8_HOLLE|nr:Sulfotransferase 1C2 [Holothuria leucospilota]